MNVGKVFATLGIGIATLVGSAIIDKGLHKIVDPHFDKPNDPDVEPSADNGEGNEPELAMEKPEVDEVIEEVSE